MAQDEKAKEPTVTFQAKGGLLTDPKPMEVHAGVGDIKPWDADSWAQFEQMGKPRPRAEAPAQGHRPREVHLRRQAARACCTAG